MKIASVLVVASLSAVGWGCGGNSVGSSNVVATTGAGGAGGGSAGDGGAAGGAAGGGAAGGGGNAAGAGGAGGPGGGAGNGTGTAGTWVSAGTVCGAVMLAASQTIAAGQTVTICAGSTITMTAPSVGIAVQGTLIISGTAAAPVSFRGQGHPGDWTGLDIQKGGSVSGTYLEIHDATLAIATRTGSAYSLDHVVIDNSNALLQLASDGTLAHGTLHGLGNSQAGSPVFIDDASPRITDTVINQGYYGAVDMVVASGAASAPVFDHVEVADSHCAFHFNQGTGATISNSFVHHNAYGFMVISSTNGHVVHNNFEDNSVNIGSCVGGSTEAKDNYFVGAAFDSTCASLSVTGTAPSAAYTDVGPSP